MKNRDLPPATIIVGNSSSYCNNCGKETLLDDERHEDISGYMAVKGGGCGITFTHINSAYIGLDVEETVRKMRPDLEFIPNDVTPAR